MPRQRHVRHLQNLQGRKANSMCEFCFFNGTTYLYVSNQRIMHLCSRCYNGKSLGKVRVKRIKVVHAKHPELRGAVQ